MQIETIDELCEQIADWAGCYGTCPNDHSAHQDVNCDSTSDMCCRTKFCTQLRERIGKAVATERKLKATGIH